MTGRATGVRPPFYLQPRGEHLGTRVCERRSSKPVSAKGKEDAKRRKGDNTQRREGREGLKVLSPAVGSQKSRRASHNTAQDRTAHDAAEHCRNAPRAVAQARWSRFVPMLPLELAAGGRASFTLPPLIRQSALPGQSASRSGRPGTLLLGCQNVDVFA